LLSAAGSSSGFDLVGSFITLAKLFVLKKSWQSAADFAVASLALAFRQRGLNPDALRHDAFNGPDHDVHPDVLRFLSDHSCLVHIFVLIDRSAEILPYLPMLERIVNLNMLQMHHADSVPPVIVFHVAASEVYRAANMPARSAAAMKDAIDLLQVDPGIQRRLAHAPTSHTGNLSFDPRVMTRLLQSQTLLATRMKQRDEKEDRVPEALPYRPPRLHLPISEFELPGYGPGASKIVARMSFCLFNDVLLFRVFAQTRPLGPLPGHHADFEETWSRRQGVNGPLGCACKGAESIHAKNIAQRQSREHWIESGDHSANAGCVDICARFVGWRKRREMRF
jgi:hypothetical protein